MTIIFLIINLIILILLTESLKASITYSPNKEKQKAINEMIRKSRKRRKIINGKKENKLIREIRIMRREFKSKFMRKKYYSLSDIHEDIKKYKYTLYFLLAIEILIFSFSENPSITLMRIFIVILLPFIYFNITEPFFQI